MTLGLCWLVAVNLRTVILGVAPVLPVVQRDLGISNTSLGFLSALPVLCMGFLAWPSASVIARLGGRVAVALGLGLLAVGAALRVIPGSPLYIFAFTFVLSVGITLGQTTLPVLVRQWFPQRIGIAAAVYANGLVVGETIAVAITGPVFLRLFGPNAWPATFILWSLPVTATLLLWLVLAPSAPPLGFARSHAPGERPPTTEMMPRSHDEPESSPPTRHSVRAWRLGALLGSGSLVYFGMNAWIPPFDQAVGHSAATADVLAALNAAQIPVSVALTLVAQRLVGRRWPFVVAGVVVLGGLCGWLWAPQETQILWVAMLGAASSFVFILGLALPPLLAGRDEVARLTGLTLSIGYSVAFFGPLLGGALLDVVWSQPAIVFLPVCAAGMVLVALGLTLPTGRFATVQTDVGRSIEASALSSDLLPPSVVHE